MLAFNQIKVLDKLNYNENAYKLLTQLAEEVTPIMNSRNWQVDTLKEIKPRNPNLLGLNYGKTLWIGIRLRHKRNIFYPYNELLGTLLHELAHIVYSDHGPYFNKLWHELKVDVCKYILYKERNKPFSGVGRTLKSSMKEDYPKEKQIKANEIFNKEINAKFIAFQGSSYTLGAKPKDWKLRFDNWNNNKDNEKNYPCPGGLKDKEVELIDLDIEIIELSSEDDIMWICKNCNIELEINILKCNKCLTK